MPNDTRSNEGAGKDAEPGKRGRDRKKGRKRGRRREPGRAATETPDVRALAARALESLERLVRELGAAHGAPARGEFPVDELALRITVAPNDLRGREARAQALVDGLRERLGEVLRGTMAFQEGRIYCFFTDRPDSPYSTPPSPVHVFQGYAANGKPEWQTFPNLCLERREPRVDRLYADPPELVVLVLMADELTGGMLPGFGRDSRAYRLIGQIVCGLVPRDLDPRGDAERVALTLQVVETQEGSGDHRLRFNVVGLTPDEIALAAANGDPRGPGEAFRRVMRQMRQKVDALSRRVVIAARRGEPIDVHTEVQQLLGRLSGELGRALKVRSHRTAHAQMRHKEGDRPTAVAMSDAREAPDGRLYRDTRRHTFVVIGPKGRAHVFSEAGKHVTSMQLQPGELDRKTERGRWLPLAPAERAALREAFDAATA